MNLSNFKSLSNQFHNIENKYHNYKVDDIIDIEFVKDDPNKLAEEIFRQPSLYAYYLNLRRIAESNVQKFKERLESFEGKKMGYVVDHIKACGIRNPTSKMVHHKFLDLFENNALYSAIKKNFKLWSNRKEILDITVKILDSRESSFKSMSFMLNSLISSGIMPSNKKHLK